MSFLILRHVVIALLAFCTCQCNLCAHDFHLRLILCKAAFFSACYRKLSIKKRKLRLRSACGLLSGLAAAVLTACGSSGTGGQNGTETASESLETSAPESAAETENDAPGPRETPSPEEIASMKAEEAGDFFTIMQKFSAGEIEALWLYGSREPV